MRKAICSIGSGPHAELLSIGLPTLREFADRHGYRLFALTENPERERPAPWGKIPLIQALLAGHDAVLWIDADAVIVDTSKDILDEVGDAVMGMVAHDTEEAGCAFPNSGVWALRNDPLTVKFLQAVWASTQYLHHKWWENAAVLDLMGFTFEGETVTPGEPTEFFRATRFLADEWNHVPQTAATSTAAPRIWHFPGQLNSVRKRWMTAALTGAPMTMRKTETARLLLRNRRT